MTKYDRMSTLFFIGLAIVICEESIRIGAGSLSNPGPGLIPLGSGLILGIFGLIVLVRTFKEFIKGKRGSLGAGNKMAEYRFGAPFDDRLCLFNRLLGISSGDLSLDGLRVSRDWKNGMGGDDFHLGGHDVLQLSSLRALFRNPLSSRNLGVLNGYDHTAC